MSLGPAFFGGGSGSGGSGTVTSVAISATDGVEVDSGSPITTSGTIAISLDAASQASLALADTSSQPGDNVSDFTNDAGYLTGIGAFDTDDLSEGATNLYFTDERAQDAVGGMVDSTLTYVDATPVLGVADGGIGTTQLADDAVTPAKLDETGSFQMADLSLKISAGNEYTRINQSSGDTRIQVSPDNFSTIYNAITIDKDNGFVGINTTPLASTVALSVAFIPSGDFTPVINSAYGNMVFKGNNNGYAGMTIAAPNSGSQTGAVAFADQSSGIAGLISYTHASDRMMFWTGVAIRMRLEAGLRVGSPSGGDKGAGTINAEAVYDDNTLLSCYVFDRAIDGVIDAVKWDAKVPDRIIEEVRDPDGKVLTPSRIETRQHLPMRKFAARAKTQYDPLTLDGYAKHWKEKRHLTSMPNEDKYDVVDGALSSGEWIQRLVETVEIQAVLIEELNQKVKALKPQRLTRK